METDGWNECLHEITDVIKYEVLTFILVGHVFTIEDDLETSYSFIFKSQAES